MCPSTPSPSPTPRCWAVDPIGVYPNRRTPSTYSGTDSEGEGEDESDSKVYAFKVTGMDNHILHQDSCL